MNPFIIDFNDRRQSRRRSPIVPERRLKSCPTRPTLTGLWPFHYAFASVEPPYYREVPPGLRRSKPDLRSLINGF
jgi:hypothetical protein